MNLSSVSVNNGFVQSDYEISKLLSERGDFILAQKKLEEILKKIDPIKSLDIYLKCQALLIRICSEQLEFDKVAEIKASLQDIIIRKDCELTSKIYYVLGVCATYKKESQMAQEYFEKALVLALKTNNQLDICYAILGLSASYFAQGKFDEALDEIKNLDVFFQVLDLKDIYIVAQLLKAQVLMRKGQYDEALGVLWKSYEALKVQKNYFYCLNVLYFLGRAYISSGDKYMAKVYLDLASKMIDEGNLKRLHRDIQEARKSLGDVEDGQYDISLNTSSNMIIEKTKGSVEFKNQFILLDLLRLLANTPGKIYSKEDLIEQIWQQDYNPIVHDNKIYVTIKRLRKLIEPEYEKPKYIFRSKKGYYFSKQAKVLIE